MDENPQLADLNASAEFIPRRMQISRMGLVIGTGAVVLFGINFLLSYQIQNVEFADRTESLIFFGVLAVAGLYAYLVPRLHSVMIFVAVFAVFSIKKLLGLFLDEAGWSTSGNFFWELYNFLFMLAGEAYSLYKLSEFAGAYRKTKPKTTRIVERLIAEYGQKSIPTSPGVIELQQDDDGDVLDWRILLDEPIALMLAFPYRKRGLRQVVAAYFVQPSYVTITSETTTDEPETTSAEIILPEDVRLSVEMDADDVKKLRDWNAGALKREFGRIDISTKLNAFLN